MYGVHAHGVDPRVRETAAGDRERWRDGLCVGTRRGVSTGTTCLETAVDRDTSRSWWDIDGISGGVVQPQSVVEERSKVVRVARDHATSHAAAAMIETCGDCGFRAETAEFVKHDCYWIWRERLYGAAEAVVPEAAEPILKRDPSSPVSDCARAAHRFSWTVDTVRPDASTRDDA